MPFHAATQPELEELLTSLRLVEQRVQRVAQGSYPAPLEPTARLELANLSTRLATALAHLDVLGEGTVSLGPNDVIVVNGGSYGSTGQRYTVTVENNVITKIEPTP